MQNDTEHRIHEAGYGYTAYGIAYDSRYRKVTAVYER